MAVQDLKIFPHILNLYLWVMINPHVGNSELYLLHWAAGFEQEKSEAEQDESCSNQTPIPPYAPTPQYPSTPSTHLKHIAISENIPFCPSSSNWLLWEILVI